MRFATIVGARPQFIKAAALSLELRKAHEEFLVHTGQHYDHNMSQVFFRELGIPAPDVHLGVGSGTHGGQTAAMLAGIEDVLLEQRPDAVIVFGDTNSTLAGALAAVKLHVPVAHVEAGLRSFNRAMPEEINRIVTDHLSTWLFVPSQTAVDNLAREGIVAGVHNVGDIMYDAVRLFAPNAAERSTILDRLGIQPKRYAVATVHRAANTDCPNRLRGIFEGLASINLPVILPLHPRTRAAAAQHGIDLTGTDDGKIGRSGDGRISADSPIHRSAHPQIKVIDPLGYLDMLQLQQHAAMILTDSGGMQKEACWLETPCLTLREETEWMDTVECGWNVLVGADRDQIVAAANATLDSHPTRTALPGLRGAASRISRLLCT